MPFSTNYFKEQTKNYINSKFNKNINILDVGAGAGTYANLLKPLGFNNIDCVEVFDSYVKDYSLNSKYRNVIIGDITQLDIDFSKYDLIIFGDVLEHIEESEAIKILSKINNIPCIICVPFESQQGEHFGNVYETHLQPDLTLDIFCNTFKNFYPLCLRFDYGVFINKKDEKKIYIEIDEKPLKDTQLKLINDIFSKHKIININKSKNKKMESIKSNLTIVTGLWNMGRGDISDSFKRGYDNYLEKFSELLKTDINMYIFIDPSDEEFIWKYRKKENTVINKMSLDMMKEWFNFTNLTNEIRQKDSWLSQASWLKESPQATLESYNPVVMSKMFMLNNVTIWNPFNSEYFFWIDAGITNTVHYGYFTHDKVFNNLPDFIDTNNDFVFLSYPYIGGDEIHGFERNGIARYCNTEYVKYVCRGGFFGGKKERINEINGLYYSYLNASLSEGLMGTEESIFTIISHNHQDLITQYGLESNGLVWPFFEKLKDKNYIDKVLNKNKTEIDIGKVGLYVITFNSPTQFETLVQSMLNYDPDFIYKTKKFLLDNSTDLSTTPKYKELCDNYGFEHIKKDNLGICGGRQFVSDHFNDSDLDVMVWSEDDMFFQNKPNETCKNGFNRYIPNLYKKSLDILKKENFDFLKINFTEFYGDNSICFPWYNVPQDFRQKHWPNNPKLPKQGLDPNAPKTKFNNIKSHQGLPYATGEIFYCNWTHFITKEGNRKMFQETKFQYPFENTWMSFIYQETIKGKINPGLLLLTPIEHNRFHHYESNLRKEN